ncbi:MAG TPA: hypothetical protein DCL74_00345 [Succinivibrionaceae bacterium]|mgnify:CR=1 FL=1|nr:hypothetical protein [Succinivibrionaceae bacterium]
MSTSATVIFCEDGHLPLMLYSTYDGAIATYSPQYDRVTGVGMTLYSMTQHYQKLHTTPSAEQIANEFLLLSSGSCRLADGIHDDCEYLYTMAIHNDIANALRTVSLRAYAIAPWKFKHDSPFFKIRSWLLDPVPAQMFEHCYHVREIGSVIKKALKELPSEPELSK